MNNETTNDSELSKTLAAEDVRRGDFVSILYEVIELPSYLWFNDSYVLPPDEPVRMKWRTSDCGTPLKVKAVCLPFIFVKKPCGSHRTLDVRQHRLIRLSDHYAKTVWKAMSKQNTTRASSTSICA
jgi:hypothetical protein